jgi:hypothetical protein
VPTLGYVAAGRPSYTFDLIEVNGDDLRRDPLEVRPSPTSGGPAEE